MWYHIITIFIIVLLSYIIGLTVVGVVDKRLSDISINLPKQNVVVQMPNNVDVNTDFLETKEPISRKKYVPFTSDDKIIEGFTNEVQHYVLNNPISGLRGEKCDNMVKPGVTYNCCYEDHKSNGHKTCQYGTTNYPDPATLTPVDRRYYKYNFQPDFTLQDYVNWLWMYKNTEEDLPYEHLRNLTKLKKGIQISEIPKNIQSIPRNTAVYFDKLYNHEDLNMMGPLGSESNYLMSANESQYPTPVVNYQKYKQPYERQFCNERNKCEK